jgi:hypothetical protein
VYEWKDEDNNNECSPLERTKVGTNSVYLDGSIDNPRSIEIPVFGLDADGNADESKEVNLKDNTSYIVMAHTAPLDPSVERYQLLGYTARTFTAFDRSVNYSAASLAFDTLKIDRAAGSLFGLDGASTEDVEDRNYEIVQNGATQSAVYLEMDLRESTGTYDVNDKAQVTTFPNPASRELYVDLSLENPSDVRIEMVAMDGRIAATKSFGGVSDSRLRLDLGGVISGTYSVLIHTANGVITRKVVVQK